MYSFGQVKEWLPSFPSRRGVFGVVPCVKSRVRVGVHYEFSEFHRRISGPLIDGTRELSDYVLGLLSKVDPDSPEGVLLALVQVCVVDEVIVGRIPRWLLHLLDIEELVLEAMNETTSEARFWEIVCILAIFDLSPVVAKLLSAGGGCGGSSNTIPLLIAYFEDVPSLFDIGESSIDAEEVFEKLEKRRHLASVAFHKSSRSHLHWSSIEFIWKLQIMSSTNDDEMVDEILNRLDDEIAWYAKVGLVWAWLHPLDAPGEALGDLVREIAQKSVVGQSMATVLDACVYSLYTLDLPSLFITVLNDNESLPDWFGAIIADIVFYANVGLIAEIREEILFKYAVCLEASGEGICVRMALDIVDTLSCRDRVAREFLGRYARSDALIGATRQWLLTVKLAHETSPSLAHSVCMEKFHTQSHKFVDSILTLVVAAEVCPDVHLGACRISDFLDKPEVYIEAMQKAQICSLGKINLLPEYIESGRFDWLCAQTCDDETTDEGSNIILSITSQNCPPEQVLPLVCKLREKKIILDFQQIVAIQKILIDMLLAKHETASTINSLLSWLCMQLVK